jgi:hypothetical protein
LLPGKQVTGYTTDITALPDLPDYVIQVGEQCGG